ncbi:glycosyltransferase involved in cell wall biosynthesis [Yoonia maricola]|uniref:Glycosyltransferase involved in cell wall biosynthesis n=1 Tax=Yoonia maricola TaxID=420999 RepID=A0A2M8W0H4_9RHOB|nr:glycosyltransferase family 4 protein [Yoonia maricola]PJI84423.1 glycosyltransferase involved in cell wall biosynthesis [Yoonia maricola]
MRTALAVPGDLATLTGGYIYDRRLLHELRALGIDVTHIALPGSFPEPPARDMDAAFAQLASIPDDCPVIIDGLAFGAMDPARTAQVRAPIVALVHHPLALENGLDAGRAQALYDSERANLSRAVQVIVPSPHTAALLVTDYGVSQDRIHIARPGTDRPSEPACPVDPPLILSVGIQLPRKGHDVLLKALTQITDLDWQAKIVGAPLDAGYAQELADLRLSLGLADRVKLTGQIGRNALRALFGSATLFALATRFEGYGIVFDEALAHDLPIVSCAAGAVPDTVPPDAGILVPPDAPEAFANALRQVLSDPDCRQTLTAAARTAGQALPTWQDTAAIAASAIAATKADSS